MMGYIISGIQQIGIGVPDLHEGFEWYRKNFGMDIRIFEDESTAELMLPYTKGKPRERHAILVMNMRGGGGFEIWQHKGKDPEFADNDPLLGDYGIFVTKLKTSNIEESYLTVKNKNNTVLSKIESAPNGKKHFFVKDLYGNIFQFIEEKSFFHKTKSFFNGGAFGAIIGVSDINKALPVYKDILGYETIVYDQIDCFDDFHSLPGSNGKFRRVMLKHAQPRSGSFSRLLGDSQIELVQAIDSQRKSIFQNRMWGDPGFIHICFDIKNMHELKNICRQKGFPFTVDSSDNFNMGEAAGHFSYIEDPDGTLIEFVETYRIPIIKKIGWYINLKKRNPEKPLPNWILRSLKSNRVKN